MAGVNRSVETETFKHSTVAQTGRAERRSRRRRRWELELVRVSTRVAFFAMSAMSWGNIH